MKQVSFNLFPSYSQTRFIPIFLRLPTKRIINITELVNETEKLLIGKLVVEFSPLPFVMKFSKSFQSLS